MIAVAKSNREIRKYLTRGLTCKELIMIQNPLIVNSTLDQENAFILKPNKKQNSIRIFNNAVHYSIMGQTGNLVDNLPNELQKTTLKQMIQLDYPYILLQVVPLYNILFRLRHSFTALFLNTIGAQFVSCTKESRNTFSARDIYTKHFLEIGIDLVPREIVLPTTSNFEYSTARRLIKDHDKEIRGLCLIQKDEKNRIIKSMYIIAQSEQSTPFMWESNWLRGVEHPLSRDLLISFLDRIKKTHVDLDHDMLNTMIYLTLQSHYSKII